MKFDFQSFTNPDTILQTKDNGVFSSWNYNSKTVGGKSKKIRYGKKAKSGRTRKYKRGKIGKGRRTRRT